MLRRCFKAGFSFSARWPGAKALPPIVQTRGPAETRRIARIAIELWPHQIWAEGILPNRRRR
jgi:hypothetical protein